MTVIRSALASSVRTPITGTARSLAAFAVCASLMAMAAGCGLESPGIARSAMASTHDDPVEPTLRPIPERAMQPASADRGQGDGTFVVYEYH